MTAPTPCAASVRRAGMTDDEFWQDVAESLTGAPDPFLDPDTDDVPLVGDPCPECGESGACAYDAEGRPLIHTTPREDPT